MCIVVEFELDNSLGRSAELPWATGAGQCWCPIRSRPGPSQIRPLFRPEIELGGHSVFGDRLSMGSDNKRPPSKRNDSPVSKRQRVDRSAPPSAAPSPVPTDQNSPSTSRNSTPQLETRRNVRSRTQGTETPAPDEDEPTPADEPSEDGPAGEEEVVELEGEGDVPAEHHTISAKTLPDHQPRPGEGKAQTNGARPTVGGKGQKGEEALEHAVAAREQVERRRVEYREENIKTGQVPKPQADSQNGEVVAAEEDAVNVDEGAPAQDDDAAQPVSNSLRWCRVHLVSTGWCADCGLFWSSLDGNAPRSPRSGTVSSSSGWSLTTGIPLRSSS